MDAILQFLIDWGYVGLFIGSFVAGSVIPFSSEAVLAACVGPLGLDPILSTLAATLGNVAGGMTCYWMGHLGNMVWIEKYFHVKKEKIENLKKQLDEAVAVQNFELAAKLRDEIKELG